MIAEDGDEYLETLGRMGGEFSWLQAKSARVAVELVGRHPVTCAVLDMRFDRVARGDLAGDFTAALRQVGGDSERAWRYLAQHQGLFVLAALRAAGWRGPGLIAYDFTRELRRFEALRSQYAPLDWIGDDATAAAWRKKLAAACGIATEEVLS